MAEALFPLPAEAVRTAGDSLVGTGLQGEQHQEIAEHHRGDRAPEKRERQPEAAVPFQGMGIQADHRDPGVSTPTQAVDDGMIKIPGFADAAALGFQKGDPLRIRLRGADQGQDVSDDVDPRGTVVLGHGGEGLRRVFRGVRDNCQPEAG